jgi:hypothetical protein
MKSLPIPNREPLTSLIAAHTRNRGWSVGVFPKIGNQFTTGRNWILAVFLIAILPLVAFAQAKRKVIIDQDAAGPGGTDMQAILSLINSPNTDVLGITVLTGDAWR